MVQETKSMVLQMERQKRYKVLQKLQPMKIFAEVKESFSLNLRLELQIFQISWGRRAGKWA